jgi:peptide/nickel transport system ATP-binding protein
MATVIRVDDLSVSYRDNDSWLRVLHDVGFAISRGEVFGLVGESGCGKSTIGLQLLGYRHANMRVDGGRVLFHGRDLLRLSRTELDRLRGNRIGFVPQNPTTALNPSMRVGTQIMETLFLHKRAGSESEANARTEALFDLVGLPQPKLLRLRYPHELSGGQQQRVCIAMAVACDPDLVVLDEPTTGLDVTTQEQIVELLIDLRGRIGTAMLYVTHDLGLLAQIADRIGVMYAGHMVETAPSDHLFASPRHPYTRGLIASVPRIDDPVDAAPATPLHGTLNRSELPPGCAFSPRCGYALDECRSTTQRLEEINSSHQVACQRWQNLPRTPGRVTAVSYGRPAAPDSRRPILEFESVTLAYGVGRGLLSRFLPSRPWIAVDDLSLTIANGETLALVGESGSGKSTVGRAISGLLPPYRGTIRFDGIPLAGSYKQRNDEERRRIQFIFQNPDASLNPRSPVRRILARPLRRFFGGSKSYIEERVEGALLGVSLEPSYGRRYPDQLSGGERQRVAIARALIADPDLLLCDEILSALDVSVQANIIALLRRLRSDRGISMLFISHDLAVVRTIADRVAVLFRGQLMEVGRNEDVFAPPFHPYTHALLNAVPTVTTVKAKSLRAAHARETEGAACAFAGRCPWQLGRTCIDEAPPWRETSQGLRIRCHLPLDQLPRREGVEADSHASNHKRAATGASS